MTALLILLGILIITIAFGFFWLSDKLKAPDVNIIVKTPPVEITNTVGESSNSTKSEEFQWKINPIEYMNKAKTEAHINWQD